MIATKETSPFTPVARMTEVCPPPGVYENMPAEQYHAIDALNATTIGHFCKSGLHGSHYLTSEQGEPTAAMIFGSAFHSAVLEPKDFSKRMQIHEDIGPASEVKHRKMQAEHPEAIILRKGWNDQIENMAGNIHAHTAASHLLHEVEGKNELTLIWNMEREIDGKIITVPCKARIDRFVPKFTPIEGMGEVSGIIDAKTAKDADAHSFEKAIADRGYHRQAAWYLTGAIACGLMESFHDYSYIIVACEKTAPYPVATYPITSAALEQGLTQCVEGVRAYLKFRLHGYAPGPSDTLVPLGIPNWAMKPENETPYEGVRS